MQISYSLATQDGGCIAVYVMQFRQSLLTQVCLLQLHEQEMNINRFFEFTISQGITCLLKCKVYVCLSVPLRFTLSLCTNIVVKIKGRGCPQHCYAMENSSFPLHTSLVKESAIWLPSLSDHDTSSKAYSSPKELDAGHASLWMTYKWPPRKSSHTLAH